MNFTILPIDYDADVSRIAAIELACYDNSDQDLEKTLFPSAANNASVGDALASSISRLMHDRDDLALSFVKVVDPVAAEIIAYARWQFYTTDTVSQIKYPAKKQLPDIFGPRCNAAAVEDYFGSIVQAKERLYGRGEHARMIPELLSADYVPSF
jgi:thioesterase domain-containing protein